MREHQNPIEYMNSRIFYECHFHAYAITAKHLLTTLLFPQSEEAGRVKEKYLQHNRKFRACLVRCYPQSCSFCGNPVKFLQLSLIWRPMLVEWSVNGGIRSPHSSLKRSRRPFTQIFLEESVVWIPYPRPGKSWGLLFHPILKSSIELFSRRPTLEWISPGSHSPFVFSHSL